MKRMAILMGSVKIGYVDVPDNDEQLYALEKEHALLKQAYREGQATWLSHTENLKKRIAVLEEEVAELEKQAQSAAAWEHEAKRLAERVAERRGENEELREQIRFLLGPDYAPVQCTVLQQEIDKLKNDNRALTESNEMVRESNEILRKKRDWAEQQNEKSSQEVIRLWKEKRSGAWAQPPYVVTCATSSGINIKAGA